MNRIKFGDIVKDVKVNVDRMNNPYEYYVAGDHMDSEDLTIHRKGRFATDDVGPAFVRIFKPGQILYGSRRTYLKKVAVADFSGICANTTFVFESKDHSIFDQRLLPFIMLSDSFTSWSISKSKGSTNPYVLFSDLADYEFDLPSLEEQKVLADKLWAAYRLKEGYKKLLCVTDEMVKSQFIEMFGNPLFNTKKWRWYSNINNVVTIVLGSTPNTKEPKYWDGDIKWITPAEMDDETFMINDTLRHITEFGVKSANLTKLPVGSVLFSTRAPIGKVGIAAAEMYCNQGFKSFICSNQVDSIFLYYTLKLNKEYLCSLGTGTTFKELSKKTVEGLKLGVPPFDLQKQFAIIYKQADKSKFGGFKSQFIEMLFKKPITGKVGDLVDKKIFSVKKIHSMNDIIEYIDISSVERSNHSIVETTSYVVSNAPSRAQQCVRLDDILVSTVRPINRNIAVVNSDKNNLVASTGFCVLRPKLAFKEYLLAIVQSDKYTEAMIDKASGGLYPAVNNGDVLNYGIYIPDEEFAKKFSLIYQQADKSKFELKQCIENIDKVIKSLING